MGKGGKAGRRNGVWKQAALRGGGKKRGSHSWTTLLSRMRKWRMRGTKDDGPNLNESISLAILHERLSVGGVGSRE